MGKIISICNQKGGTGKTTTAINLATAIAQIGHEVLLIDVDPQGNATSGLGINKNEIQESIYDVLIFQKPLPEIIIPSPQIPTLSIAPCNISLTGAEIELVGAMSRETRLQRALETIKASFDFIFIDTPPSLGLLTLNALVASDSIIVPIQCEFYALEGVTQLLNTVRLVRENLNKALQIEGVLLTMADFRTNLTSEVIHEIQGFFKEKVYKTIIPRNIKLSEAPSHGKPVMLYDRHSLGAKRYEEFAREFLGEEGTTSDFLQKEKADQKMSKETISKEERLTKDDKKEENPSPERIKEGAPQKMSEKEDNFESQNLIQ